MTFDPLVPNFTAGNMQQRLAASQELLTKYYKEPVEHHAAVKMWKRFCVFEAGTHWLRPQVKVGTQKASDETDMLMCFVTYLSQQIGPETVGQYLSLVQGWHIEKRHYRIGPITLQARSSVLSRTVSALRRGILHAKKIKEPLRYSHFAKWDKAEPLNEDNLAFRAISATAISYLLRPTEATLTSRQLGNGNIPYLTHNDVTFVLNENGSVNRMILDVFAVKAKVTQANRMHHRRFKVPVVANPNMKCNAPQLVYDLLMLTPCEPGMEEVTAIFRDVNTLETIDQTAWKKWITIQNQQAGIVGYFVLHSHRVGGGTEAAAADIPRTIWRACGRWASDLEFIYDHPDMSQQVRWSKVIIDHAALEVDT